MDPFIMRLIPLILETLRARTVEPSTLAGLAILSQIAKAYFPEYAAAFDVVSVGSASGAVVLPEKGKANEKAVSNPDSDG